MTTDRPTTDARGWRPGRNRTAGASGTGRAATTHDGFTIVEVLVAIVLTALLGAGVVSLLLGQGRFYETNEQNLFADESRRGAGEIAASELRMLSTADLYKTDSDEIRARFDLRRMVVCDVDALTGTVYLFVYDDPGISLPSGATGTAFSSPFAADFVYADGWTPTLNATGAQATCKAWGAPGGLDASRYRVESWGSHPVGLPKRGSVVRVYGDLSYTFQPATTGDGQALWRNGQELVAPFEAGAGFAYVMDNGSKEVSVPNSNHKNISYVRLEATAVGRGTNRYDVSHDLVFDVPFRN
jgi:prepilin-type N-terminal cleavage/methylation domain-containing protein